MSQIETLHELAGVMSGDLELLRTTDRLAEAFVARCLLVAAYSIARVDSRPGMKDVFLDYLPGVYRQQFQDKTPRELVLAAERGIAPKIMPIKRTIHAAFEPPELLRQLMNGNLLFTDMPDQRYPIVHDAAA